MAEPNRVGGVSGIAGLDPLGPDLSGGPVVDRRWCVEGDARVPVLVIVVFVKNVSQNLRASWMEPKRSGKVGQYLRVLNWLSLKGLSLLTCARLWLQPMSRKASSSTPGSTSSSCPGRRAR